MVEGASLLGIDWGSSHRRAYVLGRDGVCQRRHADRQGALAACGRFEAELADLRRLLALDGNVPVLMSGMVGGAQGWQEVAYLDTSVPLAQLPGLLAPVAGAPACFIVPGYCYRSGEAIDVMRGEETQLLGALALGHGDGWIVLPGTHSKWVELAAGRIVRLATYLTGELFAALSAGGTLAPLMAQGASDNGDAAAPAKVQRSSSKADAPALLTAQGLHDNDTAATLMAQGARDSAAPALLAVQGANDNDGPAPWLPHDADDDGGGLHAGARRAQASPALSHALFEARARVVAGGQPASQTRDYVSGLLIGAEFAAQRNMVPAAGPVTLLGAPALCARYASVARQFGLATRLIDPDQAYCAALSRLKEGLP